MTAHPYLVPTHISPILQVSIPRRNSTPPNRSFPLHSTSTGTLYYAYLPITWCSFFFCSQTTWLLLDHNLLFSICARVEIIQIDFARQQKRTLLLRTEQRALATLEPLIPPDAAVEFNRQRFSRTITRNSQDLPLAPPQTMDSVLDRSRPE